MSMRRNQLFYDSMEPNWLADSYGRSYNSREGSQHSSSRYLPEILLRVPMCCNKCEEKVREELLDMEGVYGFTCDQQKQRVSVIGSVDPFQVLKKMKRIKRKSELWNENTYMNGGRAYMNGRRGSNLDAQYVHREEPVYRLSLNQRQLFNEPFRSTSYATPYRNSYIDSPGTYSSSHSSPPFSYETPYRNSYIDSPGTYSSTRYPSPPFSYVTHRNSYNDSPGTYSSSRYPSPPFRLPYSSSFQHERVLPYAQNYCVEEYPSWRY